MNRLVAPLRLIRRLMSTVHRTDGSVDCPLRRVSSSDGGHRWLLQDPDLVDSDSDFARLRVTSRETERRADCDVILLLGTGAERGDLAILPRQHGRIAALDELLVVGPGMHRIRARRADGGDELASPVESSETEVPVVGEHVRDGRSSRWSRTIGALGGEAVWNRLTNLHFAIVGCGRTGSVLASSLVRLGVDRLTLVDPDELESHNLGEMEMVTANDVGASKVEALAGHLAAEGRACAGGPETAPAPTIRRVQRPVTAAPAIRACREADVIVSCVDGDAARIAAALVSVLDHKVLLDVGTSVRFRPASPPGRGPGRRTGIRRMGADVRLILPGSACLLCMGSVVNYQDAIQHLIRGEPPSEADVPWDRQRAGSLRTLNQIAAHVGLQMVQDLVAERVGESMWARLRYSDSGRLRVDYPSQASDPNPGACPLCAEAGRGTEALA